MTQLSEMFGPETSLEPEPTPVTPPRADPRPLSRGRIVLALLVVGAATISAYMSSAAQDPTYGAEAKIFVDTGGSDAESIDPVLATQRVILRSDGVLGPVAADMGMTLRKLRKAVQVDPIGQSEILRVYTVDADKERAIRMAKAVSDNYIRTVAEAPLAAEDETTNFLEQRAKELAASLDDVTKREEALEAERLAGSAAGAPPPAPSDDERRLELEAASLARRLDSVQDRLTSHELDLASGTAVRLVSPARALDDPVSPQPKRAAVGGFVVGSLLAAGALTILSLRK